MQYAYSLTHSAWAGVERVLSPQRIGRYLPAARGDKQLAFRLYLWNLRLCEAFYVPCHFCEVAIRNGLHEALKARFGSVDWHLDQKVLARLPERQKVELTDVIRRARAEHGDGATIHHLISQLPLGFWTGFLSRSYRNLIWRNGVQLAFPLASVRETHQTAAERVQQFRKWRNRIFHHNAIFDKGPTAELQNIDVLIGWRCKETQWLVRHEAAVSRVINSRPRY